MGKKKYIDTGMTMAKNEKSTFTGLLILMANVLLAVSSGFFSTSSPALSVTSAVLATIVIATKKYRLPVLLLWPVSALAVVSATLAMSSLLPVPLTLLLSPMVALVLGFLSLPM